MKKWEPRINGSNIATSNDLEKFANNNEFSSKKLLFDTTSGELILIKDSDRGAKHKNYHNVTAHYLEMKRDTFF